MIPCPLSIEHKKILSLSGGRIFVFTYSHKEPYKKEKDTDFHKKRFEYSIKQKPPTWRELKWYREYRDL